MIFINGKIIQYYLQNNIAAFFMVICKNLKMKFSLYIVGFQIVRINRKEKPVLWITENNGVNKKQNEIIIFNIHVIIYLYQDTHSSIKR